MSSLKPLEQFEEKESYAVFRPVGEIPFPTFADLLSRAVLLCHEKKIEKLLVDSTGLTGFASPGLIERFNLAERIALDARASVKIAHVAHPEWVRSGKFSVMVAKNRGLAGKNFYSESEALKWLLGGTPTS
jgi:hypothetical protein